jgi:hypothetical protein
MGPEAIGAEMVFEGGEVEIGGGGVVRRRGGVGRVPEIDEDAARGEGGSEGFEPGAVLAEDGFPADAVGAGGRGEADRRIATAKARMVLAGPALGRDILGDTGLEDGAFGEYPAGDGAGG